MNTKNNQIFLIQEPPPPIFAKTLMHDAAVIVRRATSGNSQIRLTRLHRLLQQRFPNLSISKTYQLVIQLTQLGLIEN